MKTEFCLKNLLESGNLEDEEGKRRVLLMMDLQKVICENERWMELIQDHAQ
jgi:hypothetical protein